jgi:hypothetical protein
MAQSDQESGRRGALVVATVALVVVAAAAVTRRDQDPDVPPDALGWHGAMELYRSLAMWAGKKAMAAEINYWKAAQR